MPTLIFGGLFLFELSLRLQLAYINVISRDWLSVDVINVFLENIFRLQVNAKMAMVPVIWDTWGSGKFTTVIVIIPVLTLNLPVELFCDYWHCHFSICVNFGVVSVTVDSTLAASVW